jgi:phosphoglycerate dehydrogenase-like enzyme
MMYSCARALPQGEKWLRRARNLGSLQKDFGSPPVKEVIEFHDKTLGIIGLGRIGGKLSRKAATLFQRILAVDPYIPDERFTQMGAFNSSLEEVLTESDVISIHCNLTEETHEMINAHTLGLMKRQPILINTARGAVVQEEDLLEGLLTGKLHSIGLDVYQDEPPGPNRDSLLNHPRVIATGHYAWYSENAMQELQQRAAHNLLMLLQGEIPEDCLNP